MSTISALVWIPRGAAREKPVRFELTAEDVQNLQPVGEGENTEDGEEDDEQDIDNSREAVMDADEDDTELPAELEMDNYDNERDLDVIDILNNGEDDDEDDDDRSQLEVEEFGPGFLATEVGNEEDEEDEDDYINNTDALLALAITDEDCSHLEIQVLTTEGSLYTHHDIVLPDFPLCLAWLDCPPIQSSDGGQRAVGSYCAVGSFSPAIEIWNLDVLDPLEPSAVLGGTQPRAAPPSKKKGGKGKKQKQQSQQRREEEDEEEELDEELKPGSHDGAVLSLAWNSTYRQALASGGADNTVKVWDVTTQQVQLTLTHHTDKVQALAWHGNNYSATSSSPWLLASGSFDRTVYLSDCRSGGSTLAASLGSDIESLAWDPFASHLLWGSAEGGEIFCIDARRLSGDHKAGGSGLLCTFQAHSKAVSAIAFSAAVPGMFASASLDKTVRIWDASVIQQQSATDVGVDAPQLIAQKSLHVGKLFTLRFNDDDGFMLAAAGDKGQVAVWESDEMDTVRHHFEHRVLPVQSPYLSKLAGSEGEASANNSNSAFPPLQLSIPLVAALADAIADNEDDEEGEGGKKKSKKKKNKKNKKKKKDSASNKQTNTAASMRMDDDDSDND